jgi:hypothetical protein
MQKLMTLIALMAAFALNAPARAQVPADAPTLTLSTPGLSIRLAPKKAWTPDLIQFKGKPLSTPNSNYGLVLDLGNNRFVGTGHTEGGSEDVRELRVEADGKPVDITKGGTVEGQDFLVVKKSRVAFLDLETTLRLHGDTLAEEHQVTVRENGSISKMYGFMWAWLPSTTQWMAQTVGGRAIEGTFDNSGWEMEEDVRWSALFEPVSQTAILTEFPPDLPAGAGRKHAFWDLAAYHKQYYQPLGARELKAGETFHFAAKVRALPATAANWKEVVRAAVGSTPAVAKTPVQQEIEKRFPPYAAGEKPGWLQNRAGIEALDPNVVLKPWTPVKADDKHVEVWNRKYQIGDWGLPRQVEIGGEDFLAAPISFDLKLEGEKPIHPAAKLAESFPGVARFQAGSTPDMEAQAQVAYEYDGFVRADIEVNAPPNTRAQEWELVIPFKPENAQFFSAIHASSIKMESQQQNSISGKIPGGEGEVWSSDFRPLIWIGNRDAGLCWFSESREFWSPEINAKAIRIVRLKDRVELRIALIAAPTVLPQKIKLSFGLMATPTKPRPQGWRGWNFATHQSVAGHSATGADAEKFKPRGNQIIFWSDAWRIVGMYPRARDPQAFREEVAFLKKNGASRVYPYIVASHITGSEKTHIPGEDFVFTAPEWKAFGKEWELNPNRKPEDFRRMSPATPFADWQLAAIKDWIVNDGVNGIYVDESYPYPDTVASHGMGFVNSKGERVPTYQIYAMRDYFKRMAYLFQKFGDGPPAIIAHASGVLAMPHLSFADIFLDGEQVYHRIRDWDGDGPPSYLEMTPLDQWGAEFSGRQFGFVPLFLPAMRPNLAKGYPDLNKQIAPTREMLALAQLHDVLVWPLWSNADEWKKVVAVREEFQIGGADVQFHPFWELKNSAKADAKNVLVSSYTGTRGVLAVVANIGESEQNVAVDFSPISKQIGADWKAWNAQTAEVLPLREGAVRVTVPAKDFVLVRIAPAALVTGLGDIVPQ